MFVLWDKGKMMWRPVLFVLMISVVIPLTCLAEVKTLFAEHEYVMGDNDSKNDARRICFIEVKRRIVEQAGTYVVSRTKVKDFHLSMDEISTYAAALLKVHVVSEEWKLVGNNLAISIVIRAEVDDDYIREQLSRMEHDMALQEKIKGQQQRLQRLERKLIELQKQLLEVDQSEADSLQRQRNTIFKDIEEIDEKSKRNFWKK